MNDIVTSGEFSDVQESEFLADFFAAFEVSAKRYADWKQFNKEWNIFMEDEGIPVVFGMSWGDSAWMGYFGCLFSKSADGN